MIKAFAQSYPERVIFPLTAGLLPWKKFPEAFLKDRSDVYSCLYLLLYPSDPSGIVFWREDQCGRDDGASAHSPQLTFIQPRGSLKMKSIP